MTELIITELNNENIQLANTREQGCQTIPTCNKSTEIEESNFIIASSITERKTNYIENKRLLNYYRKRNQQTDIFNPLMESESQRDKSKKSIIDEYKKDNNKVPKWLINMKK